ncbi:MAG TPA: LytTR family DNA-binding domain-containing protein, partial [Burkholderiales bacterium]|nr:LytTR family DNA-binding domain-containing protein [Burkholderiales bacterium]
RGQLGYAHCRRALRDRYCHAIPHQLMSALRVVIVDDEQPARSRLRELLDDCRGELPHSVAGEAANGAEGLQMVASAQADVALVDIHMPEMSGIEFARHLQVLERPPAVIFVTAHDQYAIEAFEVNAVDYLTKPVRAARLLAALRKAASGARLARGVLESIDPAPRRHFSVAERGRLTLVPVSDVIYLRAELKYVTVRTRAREHLIEESLTQIEQEFGGVFVRIHRNCLVARRWIRGFERGTETEGEVGWSVILEGLEERLPVSRRQWGQVKSLAS